MPRRATIEDILSTGEKELPIPGLLDAEGEPLTLRVRKVHAGERDALMPQLPAQLFEALPEDPEARTAILTERRAAWLKTLTPAELEARTHEATKYFARLVARASLDPVLTEAQAERLGDAVVTLANQITEFSQNKRQNGAAPSAG
jgi:hypothetical protein